MKIIFHCIFSMGFALLFVSSAYPVSVTSDYDGDGLSDQPIYDSVSGNWYVKNVANQVLKWREHWKWGLGPTVVGDYDGDTKSDFAQFVPAGGYWYIRSANSNVIACGLQWGWSSAQPVPGDYDGDGKSDLAVFDTAGGYWYIRGVDGALIAWQTQWGWSSAKPVPGDYDGDGKSDLAVFDTAGGNWYILSLTGSVIAWKQQWGWSSAKPVPGDYDGDGKSDLAVFDTTGGYWYIRNIAGTVITWKNQWGWGAASIPGLSVDPLGNVQGVESPVSYLPSTTFQMGEWQTVSVSSPSIPTNEIPVHFVQLNDYFMDRYEISFALWNEVRLWAIQHGYAFDGPGSGKSAAHPVQNVSWFDAVKWCNARSEKMGFQPCYYTDTNRTTIYRTGLLYLSTNAVLWAANGYRLPTEAEWENASKNPFANRFPWGNTITQTNANYYSLFTTNSSPSPFYFYDVNGSPGFNSAYNDQILPYTAPVHSFSGNYYGLYHMSGNVAEWCWDYSVAYPSPGPPVPNPLGPDSGWTRMVRGGSWFDDAAHVRCAYRNQYSPWVKNAFTGFRCVRRLE
jgi:formylglycine-generating enzyme required for sulfatase activity